MNKRRYAQVAPHLGVLLVTLFATAACRCPKEFEVVTLGATDLNANRFGDPTNTHAWVYLLRNGALFEAADVESVIDDSEAALGADLIRSESISVHKQAPAAEGAAAEAAEPEPQTHVIAIDGSDCPRFIGIVGNFYKSDDGPRMLCVPFATIDDTTFVFGGYHITAQPR